MVWASDGAVAAVLTSSGVHLADGANLQRIAEVPAPQTNAVAFSDNNKLLITHQRPFRENGNPGRNLTVSPRTRTCVAGSLEGT